MSSPTARIGKYLLLERVGDGGMGVVHRARLDGPGGFSRDLVVKRIRPELMADPGFVERFVREARLSARLRHPGIVQVFELGLEGGAYFLSMEYVDGSDLAHVLAVARREGRVLSWAAAAFVAHEVARALDYAHELRDEQGRPLALVHRDVSPSNVMVSRAGEVKLLDFGVARALDETGGAHTRTGSLLGKVGYVAPEVLDGGPADRRADVYATGVVLWEMLAGRPLFAGRSVLDTARRVALGEVPPLGRADAPPELEAIARRALASDPAARFPTAAALAAAVEPHVFAGRFAAPQLADALAFALEGAPAASEPSQIQTALSTEGGRPRTRVFRPVAISALALAAAALVAAVALVGGATRHAKVGAALPAPEREPRVAAEPGRADGGPPARVPPEPRSGAAAADAGVPSESAARQPVRRRPPARAGSMNEPPPPELGKGSLVDPFAPAR